MRLSGPSRPPCLSTGAAPPRLPPPGERHRVCPGQARGSGARQPARVHAPASARPACACDASGRGSGAPAAACQPPAAAPDWRAAAARAAPGLAHSAREERLPACRRRSSGPALVAGPATPTGPVTRAPHTITSHLHPSCCACLLCGMVSPRASPQTTVQQPRGPGRGDTGAARAPAALDGSSSTGSSGGRSGGGSSSSSS